MGGGTRARQTSSEVSAKAGGGSSASVSLLRALILGALQLGLTFEQLSATLQRVARERSPSGLPKFLDLPGEC